MKQCSKCGELKDESEFNKDKYRKDGLCSRCRNCTKEDWKIYEQKNNEKLLLKRQTKEYKDNIKNYQDTWYQKNKINLKEIRKTYRLKSIYNLSEDQYISLLEKSKNSCEICGSKNDLCIDHSHSTKKIRGILCRKCNTALGNFGDDINLLLKSVEYLKNK